MIRIRNSRLNNALRDIRRGIKRGRHHSGESIGHLLSFFRHKLWNLQILPVFGQCIHDILKGAVHRRLGQDLADTRNLPSFGFNLGSVGVFVETLGSIVRAYDVKVDCAVLFVEGKGLVAAGTESTPDNLLNATHVPPRIHNMDLPHVPEIHTFRDDLGGHDNPHLRSIPILGGLHELEHRIEFGLRIVGGQKDIFAFRGSLVRRIGEECASIGWSVSVLFQGHRKESSPHRHKVRIDKTHTGSCFDRLQDRHKLRRVVREFLRRQEGLSRVHPLLPCGTERVLKRLVARKNGDGCLHEGSLLSFVVFPFGSVERRELNAFRCRLHETQVLEPIDRCDGFSQKGGGHRIRGDNLRRRKTEGKGEGIVALDKGDIVLAPLAECLSGDSCFEGRIRIEEVGRLCRDLEVLFAIVPEEQIHIVDDLIVRVVHRRGRQKNKHEAGGCLDEILQRTCTDLHPLFILAGLDVVGFVDNQHAIVEGRMHPLAINVRFRSAKVFLDHIAERIVGHKFVELFDDLVGCPFELVTNVWIVPVLGFGLNAKEHVEVLAPRALLGLEGSRDRINVHTGHVEELGRKVFLDGGRRNDHHLLVLKLRSEDVLFGHLDRRTRLARSRSMNEEDIARRGIRRQNSTKEPLLGLEFEVPRGTFAHLVAEMFQRIQRRRGETLGCDFRDLRVREVRHCYTLQVFSTHQMSVSSGSRHAICATILPDTPLGKMELEVSL